MSCIVGMKDSQRVIIGGDSAVVASSTIQIDTCPKVFRLKIQQDEYLIGHTGSGRIGNVLRHAFIPPPFKRHEDLETYMVTRFVDALRKCWRRASFERGAQMLVGFQGHVFWIEEDYQVGQPMQGYTAIGSGEDYALGALYATQFLDPPLDLEKRVRIALGAAAEHNVFVRPPFPIICSTRGDAL
jgi:ATP-dependent protease HslVU (ClpYQ) peptidase subunit